MNKTPALDFSGKTALVTGASRGIGEAIARSLAELGADVIIVSRKLESLEAVANSIGDRGKSVTPMACNTGHPEEIETLFKAVAAKYGKLDILVNNAATNPFYGPAIDVPQWAFDKTFEVNVKGYFLMCQHAAKLMLQTGSGSIVNIASVAGLSPLPMQVVYGMSKGAVIAMTKGLAKELGPKGIRVNAVAPGVVETKFAEAMIKSEEIQHLIREMTPLRRWAQPEEIVGSVLYLASNLSTYTTGTVLVCDGGVSS
ncbi:MAG: short-chain dehydrogenase [Acidobacteria bacterium]|nr:MAG: short-chain dehydrogenase [Acidobacteriota bacterium]